MEAANQRPSDEVADWIVRDMRSGVLTSGTWLKQIDLEARYGASRADVRRALDVLLTKRLVDRFPERGFYVPEFNEERLQELREVRVVLEAAMIPHIIERADSVAVGQLTELACKFRTAVDEGTVADRYQTNYAFHAAIADLCPNSELRRLVIDYRGYAPGAPVSQWPTHARAVKSAEEHFAMIDAIRSRDAGKFGELVRAHIGG